MKIVFGSTTLFDQERPGRSSELYIDNSVRSEMADLFEGASVVPFARGSRRRVLPLLVVSEFASQRLAEEFWLDHYDDLANSGTLTFTCGYTGDTSTRTVDAILERCIPRLVAPLVVEVDYTFILTSAPA